MKAKLLQWWTAAKPAIIKRVVLLVIIAVVVLVFPLAILRWLTMVVYNTDKAWNTSKAFDRTGNVLANGDWQEMISTRAARAMKEGRTWGCILCGILDWMEKDHCEDSVG